MGRWECVLNCGLHSQEYRNDIKGALSLRFAHMPLIDLMIIGTLNHRVPGSSPGAPTTQSSRTAETVADQKHAVSAGILDAYF
jgi:hypothetical protein